MTRLGYQIPNFTYPGVGPAGLFATVAAQAEAAEASGFDTVLVMDHFYQLPRLGQPDQEMLECYPLLGALAARTSRVRLTCEPFEVRRKLDVLAAHCEAKGRDRSTITVSWQRSVCIAPTREHAEAELAAMFARRGIDLGRLDHDQRAAMLARFAVGSPDDVGETFAGWLALGVDGFTVNAVANGHDPERVALLGQTLAGVVG